MDQRKNGVTVKVYGTENKPEHDVDDFVGVSHAMNGRPVEVRIKRGNDSHTLYLSMAEATQLSDALEAARRGE